MGAATDQIKLEAVLRPTSHFTPVKSNRIRSDPDRVRPTARSGSIARGRVFVEMDAALGRTAGGAQDRRHAVRLERDSQRREDSLLAHARGDGAPARRRALRRSVRALARARFRRRLGPSSASADAPDGGARTSLSIASPKPGRRASLVVQTARGEICDAAREPTALRALLLAARDAHCYMEFRGGSRERRAKSAPPAGKCSCFATHEIHLMFEGR